MILVSVEDIDKALMYGLGHMGAFRLMDLTGIDLSYIMAIKKYRETGDPQYKLSPAIVKKYIMHQSTKREPNKFEWKKFKLFWCERQFENFTKICT